MTCTIQVGVAPKTALESPDEPINRAAVERAMVEWEGRRWKQNHNTEDADRLFWNMRDAIRAAVGEWLDARRAEVATLRAERDEARRVAFALCVADTDHAPPPASDLDAAWAGGPTTGEKAP